MAKGQATDALVSTITPVLERLDLHLYDIELAGGGKSRTVRVLVERDEGSDDGVDLDRISEASQAIGAALDTGDAAQSVLPGPYTLEVSSPGLERPLRTQAHFARAVGTEVSVKSRNERGSVVRRRGTVVAADDAGVQIDFDGRTEQLGYDDIVQARTVFEWGAPERKPRAGRQKKKQEVAP